MTQPSFDMPGDRDWMLAYQNKLNDEFPGYVVRIVNDKYVSAVLLSPPRSRGPFEVTVELVQPARPKRRIQRMAAWLRLLLAAAPAWSIKTDYEHGALVVYGRNWFGNTLTPPVLRVSDCTPGRALRELALLALAGEPER